MTKINPKDVNIGSEALSGGIAKFVLLSIGFLGSIIFARVLGATGFGAFYLLVTVENVADRPLAGIAESVKKRLSEADADQSELFGAFLAIFLPSLLIIVTIAVLGQDWINGYVQREDGYILFIVLVVILSMQDTFNTLLAATGRLGLTSWVDALRSLLTIPSQIALVFLGLGVVGMTVGLGAASLVTATLILYLLQLRPTRPSRENFKSIYDYAKYQVPSSVTSFGYDRIALLLIGAGLGPTVAGYFEATLKLTVPALMIGMIAANMLMPKVSALSTSGESITRELRDVMSYSSVTAIPLVFGAIAIGDQVVVTVYGAEFAPAAQFLVWLAIYRVITTRTQPLVETLKGIDRPEYDLYGSLGASGVLLGLGLPALWSFGGMGILGAMICAAGTRYLIAVYFIRREIETVSHFPGPFRAQLLAGSLMFLTVQLIKQLFGVGTWPRLTFVIGVGVSAYFLLLLLISSETRHTVQFVLGDFAEDKLGFMIDFQ